MADTAHTKTTVEFLLGGDRIDTGQEHTWVYQAFNDINSNQKITNRGEYSKGYLSIADNDSHNNWSRVQVQQVDPWFGKTYWTQNEANANIFMKRVDGIGKDRGSVNYLTYRTNNGTEFIKKDK